jgi:hypothetical protein
VEQEYRRVKIWGRKLSALPATYISINHYRCVVKAYFVTTLLSNTMGNITASEFKAAHPEELNEHGQIKVCIGGGAGFIGSHIAKKLKEEVGLMFQIISFQNDDILQIGLLCGMR